MKILVLSKRNKVCGVFGAAILASQFPNAEIQVRTLEGDIGEPLPNFVKNVAHEWGLQKLDTFPVVPFDPKDLSSAATIILLTDSLLFSVFRDLAASSNVKVITDPLEDFGISGFSIEGIQDDRLTSYLAKTAREFIKVVCAIHESRLRSKVGVFIPLREEDCDLAYAKAQFESSING